MIPGLEPSFVPTAPMKTSRPIPPPRLFRCRAYVRLVKEDRIGRLIYLALRLAACCRCAAEGKAAAIMQKPQTEKTDIDAST